MRKMLSLIIVLFIYYSGHTQFKKGDRFLGGMVSFNTYGQSVQPSADILSRSNHFNTSLSVSKFKSSNRFVGFGLSYAGSYSRSGNSPSNEQIVRNNGLGFFITAGKLQQIAKKFYLNFNGNASAGYAFASVKNTLSPLSSSSKGFSTSVNAGLGIMYQLNNRLLVTGGISNLLSISYYTSTIKTKSGGVPAQNSYKSNSFGIYTGLSGFSLNSLGFGFSYLLP